MNDQQRIETAADNCEVLRARLAKYEDAEGNPIAQPAVVVLPDPKKEIVAWGHDMGGNYDEGHADGWNDALDEVARLNSSTVSACDDAQYPPCDYCAEQLNYHPWHGSGLINGAESRHIHACDKCRHLLPVVSAGGVDERVPELSSFVAFADALGLDLRQADDQWDSALALYEKLIAAYPQARASLSAPSLGEQVREYGCDYAGCDSKAFQGTGLCLHHHTPANRQKMLATAPSAGSQKEQK